MNASPDFDVAINNLGRVYAEMGQLQRALYFFYRATYVNPNNLRALSNIAVAYQRINKLDALEEIAGLIIERFPEAPEGFFRLGMCREAQERFPEAISAWEESLKRAVPGDPLIQANRGQTWSGSREGVQLSPLIFPSMTADSGISGQSPEHPRLVLVILLIAVVVNLIYPGEVFFQSRYLLVLVSVVGLCHCPAIESTGEALQRHASPRWHWPSCR